MPRNPAVLTRAFALAVAAVCCASWLAGAAPANAEMLTYADQHEVWVATPDGSTKRQITTDGTSEHPWTSPTSDDQGRILAAKGNSTRFMDQTGTALPNGTQLTPMEVGGIEIGPLWPAVNARGDWVAYSCSDFSFSRQLTWYVGLTGPQTITASGNQIHWSDWYQPTWYGNRLVVSDNQKLFVQPAVSDPPAPAAPDFGYAFIQRDGVAYTRGAIARNGRRILLEGYLAGQDGSDFLNLARMPGGVPAKGNGPDGVCDQECRIATAGSPQDASFSPDGSKIAWSDAEA